MANATKNSNAKAKIAVLVSGGGTNLQALIDAEKSGVLKSGTICLVVSNKKTAYARERAERESLPCSRDKMTRIVRAEQGPRPRRRSPFGKEKSVIRRSVCSGMRDLIKRFRRRFRS